MANPPYWQLGQTSEFYESGGNGPGTISGGEGDYGGVSYGRYQFSTNAGTLNEYLNQSAYADKFTGLQPGTPAFNTDWTKLANTDPVGFSKDQHDFVKTSHYDVQMQALKNDGVDLSRRGPAVQDALWSTSVEFRGNTPSIFEKGLEEKFGNNYILSNLTDKDIVDTVQDYKIEHIQTLFKHSPRLWESLSDRATNEKMDLDALADGRTLDPNQHVHTSHEYHRQGPQRPSHGRETILEQGMHGDDVKKLQTQLSELGYLNNTSGLDGKLGSATEAALKAFQHDHGLEADGKAGIDTRQALRSSLHLLEQDQTTLTHLKSPPAANASSVDDPRNACSPNHALFNDLKERFPDASENRLMQFTASCHVNGINEQNLQRVVFDQQHGIVGFGASGLPGGSTFVDMKQPSPQPEQSIQQIQQHNQQQALNQAQAQLAQLDQQQQSPVLGGP